MDAPWLIISPNDGEQRRAQPVTIVDASGEPVDLVGLFAALESRLEQVETSVAELEAATPDFDFSHDGRLKVTAI